MRFVVDESSVQFAGVAPKVDLERFEQLLDRIDDVLDHKYKISYSADLFINPVLNDRTLFHLYTATPQFHIPREVQERVAVIFGRLTKWDDVEADLPPAFEVSVGNFQPIFAPSIAWVHDQAIKNGDHRSACIVMPPSHFEGVNNVTCAGRTLPISFISSNASYVQFFRWVIEKTTKSPSEIDEFSGSAFPNIRIIPGATNGIKDMSKPYVNLVQDLVQHLSVFSDEGNAAFGSGSWQNVPAHFGSKGINISDENGNTKANRQAQQERTKVVDGRTMTFWWHSKLEPDRDRIHVYPDDIATGGKLIVGIFCRHLT
jgi:hypothetical protein